MNILFQQKLLYIIRTEYLRITVNYPQLKERERYVDTERERERETRIERRREKSVKVLVCDGVHKDIQCIVAVHSKQTLFELTYEVTYYI